MNAKQYCLCQYECHHEMCLNKPKCIVVDVALLLSKKQKHKKKTFNMYLNMSLKFQNHAVLCVTDFPTYLLLKKNEILCECKGDERENVVLNTNRLHED